MRRRDFIKAIASSAVAWPLVARAQQSVPVIGFLSFRSANESAASETAFRQGLKEFGFIEGRNVHIAFRWAEGREDRLPALAKELVELQVSAIAAMGGGPSVVAAKAATKVIPIVFTFGGDPIQAGLVSSLSHPEGNLTGVTWFSGNLAAKRLALLHDLVPADATVALIVNPRTPDLQSQPTDAKEAARRLNRKLVVLNASTEQEIGAAFATMAEQKVAGVVVGGDSFFINRREQIVALATRNAVPAIYSLREFVASGGLMSYGNNLKDAYRTAGLYVGRILRGAKPDELPVERLTKFELVVNAKVANRLGLTLPNALLVTADELIE